MIRTWDSGHFGGDGQNQRDDIAELWRVIAGTREAQGDHEGALRGLRNAESLEGRVMR